MQIQNLQEYQKTQHPILALECETPLKEAIRYMNVHDYGSVICTDNGKYHGIFTARQLLKKIEVSDRLDQLRLRDVVRTDGPVAHLEDDAEKKLEDMQQHHVHYMPIVDDKNRCVGVLSQGDFAAYTLEQAGTRFAEALKNKAEDRTNPPSMVIMMGLYVAVMIGVGAAIFW